MSAETFDLAVIGALLAVLTIWVVSEVLAWRAKQQRKRWAQILRGPMHDERSSIQNFRRAR